MSLNSRELKFLTFIVAIWGITMIYSGYSLQTKKSMEVKKIYTVRITSNQAGEIQEKKAEIELKKLEIEIGNPLSMNAKTYLENANQFNDIQLKQLSETLDTSLVNINQPGTYKYFITYKKKKYEGTIIIKEKEVKTIQNTIAFTLKPKVMPTTGTISREKKDYIYEELTPEVYNEMILDLREVETNQSIPGKYKYTITYKDTVYYGDYEIVEDVITNRVTITCPAETTPDTNNNTCLCINEDEDYDEETKTCVSRPIEEEAETIKTTIE